ncbi:hypothetical protein DE146DRAFT_749992 [Phaeosphaeria sp. MPI-PUGE-AT-0046c]|nr:hypothetical protein DE146DRAFT_749992 [Phaeosphaeria sp. MPI-PUGE-AT-0046c]
MANFRALQPAPLDEQLPPQQPQTRPLLTQKPKRTVTLGACVACRKRKSKCDGNRPVCTCCSQKDTDCVYELGPNEKPSQAMKRKNEEMQGELSNLRQLYDFLRLRPEQEAIDVLRRIRVNSADTTPSQRIQELADFVRRGDAVQQSPSFPPPPYHYDAGHTLTLPSIRQALDSASGLGTHELPFPGILPPCTDGPSSQRRRHASDVDVSARSDSEGTLPPPTSIEALLHPAPHVVVDDVLSDPRLASAKNWTTVTTDADLLISILSSWTSQEYVYYHYLDRDAFLDDMACNRSDFCSELLVNALLASACSTSSVVKDRSIPFSEVNIATAFYREATRLWELEAGSNSLTKIHAAVCLYLFLGKVGRDKAAHEFLAEACRMSYELGLFGASPLHASQRSPSILQDNLDHVRAVTAWSLFNFQLNMAFTYSFPAIITAAPLVAIPYDQNPDSEALFRSECARYAIICDGANAIRKYKASNGHEQHAAEIDACHTRLMSWWHARPPSLHPESVSSKENILCALMHHVNIINLFQPILDHDTPSHIHNYHARARAITSSSLLELRRLLTLQERRHCWGLAITLVLHPIMVASSGSLEEIERTFQNPKDAERSEVYQGVVVCLRALVALATFNYYAQALFRLLTQKCQVLGLQLPDDLQNALDAYTSEEWTKKAANLVSSQYIADSRKMTTDSEGARMDSIISTWENLSLDDKGKGKAKAG